ncbi:MAG: homocysteine S-methyltransferase family protein, partial [Peptococcaceae bacterium]|nr:homocysteine S-methyltransferase family protein [Peptococcaceae bacterium]
MEALRHEVLLADGAMGTELQERGLPAGSGPEAWMLENPAKIAAVHEDYARVGSRIIESNTFGANRLKLAEFGCQDKAAEINTRAVKLARQAAGPNGFVAGLIGPTGQFPSPLGDIPFEELMEVFAEQARALSAAGADLIYLQTFSDLGEARAAYLAAREVTNLPVAVSLTYDERQRTLTGTDPETAATVFSALGADILGVNCSVGPGEMLPIADRYHQSCRLPLLAEPNAGIPSLVEGRSVFSLTPAVLAEYAPMFLEVGVRYLGGCCGTTPAHIKAVAAAIKNWDGRVVVSREAMPSRLASRSRTIFLGAAYPPRLIGERINPTSRKALAEALRTGDYQRIVREGLEQIQAGADLLDVNAGLAGGDDGQFLPPMARGLQHVLDCPLSIDTVNPIALERALLHFQGKALINSVNGDKASMDSVFPLARRYGAAVLGLTLDGKGIPDTAAGRLAIAERILERALLEGLPKEDVFIDCLVLAAAAEPKLSGETLAAIRLVKEKLGLTTLLGLSNISHGMPKRPWLNQAFLAQALAAGLDGVIANPMDAGIRQTLAAGAFLAGRDPRGERYIARAKKEDALAAA